MEEIERRIIIAASRKRPRGARQTGSISRRRGGVLVESRSLAGARVALLRKIGDDIVEEAKNIYRKRRITDDKKYLTNQGRTKDPRVTDVFPHDYLRSFDVTPLPSDARGGIRIINKARVRKSDPHTGRTKTYRYGDVSEWGRPSLIAEDRMFKIGLRTRYAESVLKGKKRRSKGKLGPAPALEKTTIYNPETGSFIKYDDKLKKYYQYTNEVPEIKPSGIIAEAVDIVLGRLAGNEVRRRT